MFVGVFKCFKGIWVKNNEVEVVGKGLFWGSMGKNVYIICLFKDNICNVLDKIIKLCSGYFLTMDFLEERFL